MDIKKELNQKKMELDVVQREYKEIREKIKGAAELRDSKEVVDFAKTKENLDRIKEELNKFTQDHNKIKDEIVQEQSILRSIKQQQIETQKELEGAASRLYNAKEELDKKEIFQDESVLSPEEKEFIEKTNENASQGVIEAASAVVGSLKSKLNMTEKELETVQNLLEKERNEHEDTKRELERLKDSLEKS